MSAGLESVRRAMADYLNEKGVRAITAWPAAPRQEREEPVVVVSLRGCRAGAASWRSTAWARGRSSSFRSSPAPIAPHMDKISWVMVTPSARGWRC